MTSAVASAKQCGKNSVGDIAQSLAAERFQCIDLPQNQHLGGLFLRGAQEPTGVVQLVWCVDVKGDFGHAALCFDCGFCDF